MFKKLWTYAHYQFKVSTRYKVDNVLVVLSTFIAATVQYYIWRYVEQTQAMSTGNIVLYTLFALSLSMLLPLFSTADFIANKILKGDIIHVLQRPQSMLMINLFTQFGNVTYKVLYRAIPLWLMYAIVFKIYLATGTVMQLCLAIVSFGLSWLLAFLIGHCLGLLATVVVSINGIKNFVSGALLIFGGGLLPIDLYPSVLKEYVFLTPFPAISYYPVAILSGVESFDVTQALWSQVLWILVGCLVTGCIQSMTRQRMEIMGG